MIHFVIVGILVILSTGLVYFGLTSVELLPTQASEQAIIIDDLLDIHWFLIAFFFSLIVVFMLYSFVVFRRRAGEKGDGEHFESNVRLETIWTIIPLIIVIWLAAVGVDTLAKIEERDPGALVVNVVASQWNWRFEYPESGIVSEVLVLPVDRQILLRLRSEDVIHSFWVPEFRVKQDALPGGESYIRELRITPNQEGEFTTRCAELCGEKHWDMKATVDVKNSQGYDDWVIAQLAECNLSPEECGTKWASVYGCLGCHTTDGTESVGPTWLGLFGASMPMESGDMVIVDEEFLRESIIDPMINIHEGFDPIMPPDFAEKLSSQQIEDLIAFIKSLE